MDRSTDAVILGVKVTLSEMLREAYDNHKSDDNNALQHLVNTFNHVLKLLSHFIMADRKNKILKEKIGETSNDEVWVLVEFYFGVFFEDMILVWVECL